MNNEKNPNNSIENDAAETEIQEEAAQTEVVDEAKSEENAAEEKPAELQDDAENEKSPKKGFKDYFKSNRFKHGGIATAFTAGFIVVIILLNVVVSILGDRFPSMNIDLTAGGTNTLSEDSLKVVKAVKIPTTIYIVANEAQVKDDSLLASYGLKYSQVGVLAGKMQEKNSNIKVKYVDLDKDPTFTSNYSGDNISPGSVIVETKKRHRTLAVTDLFNIQTSQTDGSSTSYSMVDSALASAVSQTNSEKVPVVAFATGHDEALDMSSLKAILGSNNFETKDFNILTADIPENTQLLILSTPSKDYTQEELKKLDAFLSDTKLAASRSLLVTFHPGNNSMPNLANFLKEWGIEVPNSVVVDSDTTHLFSNNSSYTLGQIGTELDLEGSTSDYGYVAMPQSCPVNLLFTSQGNVTTHSLATSYDSSYLIDATKEEATAASGTTKKAYNLAALSQKGIKVGETSYTSNVVVIGSSMMFTSAILDSTTFGNGKYMVDLLKYATGTTKSSTGVTINKVQTNVSDITLNTALTNFLGMGLFTLLIPLSVLAAGIVVFLKRRHL